MRFLASSTDNEGSASVMASVSKFAAPTFACPAPKNKTRCSVSFWSTARHAVTAPATVTAAVPCMSSLITKLEVVLNFCNTRNALRGAKSSK